MTNLMSLGIDPTTQLSVVNATLAAIQAKLQLLSRLPADEVRHTDLLDYSQLMLYQDLLTSMPFA